MGERRSGVDLLYCAGRWAVVLGERSFGMYDSRDEAIVAAREHSGRILRERAAEGAAPDPLAYPRLKSRRHRRHHSGSHT